MPPWVARQWHAWGCSRSVSGDLYRISRIQRPIQLRFYAQSSVHNGAKLRLRTANSAVIVPSSIANTRPEDLIAHIKPVLRKCITKDRFAIFFVTPSFATWLLDDQVFLHKALRQAYKHALDRKEFPYTQLHALCAVVDKLPTSRPIGTIENTAEESLKRIENPAVEEKGHEGIAYATIPSSDSIPTSSDVAQDNAAVSFLGFSGYDDGDGQLGDSVRLPLANTVFQTGSPITMTYSTWEKAKGSQELTLKEKRNISHHGIRMQPGRDTQPTALSVPLVPLSTPREVEASMGNILRRVKGPDGASITASQELEQVVPNYFSARGEPSQATTVWALVMDHDQMLEARERTGLLLHHPPSTHNGEDRGNTSEAKPWEALWKQDPPYWNSLVSVALKSGARLHRVLSGGGGWGKKAGLLSLDPVPTLEAESTDESSAFDESDGPGDLGSALQQVAQEGDYVQFFVSPSVPAKDNVIVGGNEDKAVWGLELGTIPSTMDSMPDIAGHTETAGTNEIFVFRHTFGALAEGGMVFSRGLRLNPGDSHKTFRSTTVDVPFSRFSAVHWRTEDSPDADVDSVRDCFEPKPYFHRRDVVKPFHQEATSPSLCLESFNEKVFRQPGSTRPHISREDEDSNYFTELFTTPQEISTQWVPQKQRNPTLTPQQTAEITPGIQNVPLDNDKHASTEQITRALLLKQPPIRFYKTDTPQRDELAYCIDGLRRVDRKVARYVKEYRELMHQIRRQNGLRMDIALRQPKPGKKPLSLISKLDSDGPRGLVSWPESPTDKSEYRISMYRKYFRAHMALDTNNSATDVYTLHTQLRWALITMIMARRGHQPTALPRRKLSQLRAFRGNLFTDREDLSKRYIHARLQVMEMQHHLSRKMTIMEGKFQPLQKRKVYPLKKTYVRVSRPGSPDRLAVARKVRVEERSGPPEKEERKARVRKMDREHSAVRELEDIVKGWMS